MHLDFVVEVKSTTTVVPVDVCERDDKIYSLDNRRLKAFQEAGIPVRTRAATSDEIKKESFKFTSKNDGTSVNIRGDEDL